MLDHPACGILFGALVIVLGCGVVKFISLLLVEQYETRIEQCHNGIDGCNNFQCEMCQQEEAW
jgi:hypothetical protein